MKQKFLFYLLLVGVVFIHSCGGSNSSTNQNTETENVAVSPSGGFGSGNWILHISDIHLSLKDPNTRDTDTSLYNSALSQIQKTILQNGSPAFIIYTGDLPEHLGKPGVAFQDMQTIHHHDDDIRRVLNDLRKIAGSTPLFYSPGNNDPLAGDYFSFYTTADSPNATPISLVNNSSNPYPALNTNNACCTTPWMIASNPKAGYYSVKVNSKLRLISLNTVMLTGKYTPRDGITQQKACTDMMTWLDGQLQAASNAGDKVYLIMHVPPGIDAFSTHNPPQNTTYMWTSQKDNNGNNYQNVFLAMIEKYKGTVSTLFYGHTHMEELRILYAKDNKTVTAFAVGCPGISPINQNNPAFKSYTFNPSTFDLTGFTSWFTADQGKTWQSYSFSGTYGNCSGSMLSCIQNMKIANFQQQFSSIYKAGKSENPWDTLGIRVKYR